MYVCLECGYKFHNSQKLTETHGLSSAPYENIYVCPSCKSQNFKNETSPYCHYCGARLKKGKTGYCSEECKSKGKKAWRKEQKRKKLLFDSPIYKKVREIDVYNIKNKTKLSYGQYTSLIKKGKNNG